jgi:hypothetical protein
MSAPVLAGHRQQWHHRRPQIAERLAVPDVAASVSRGTVTG